MPVFIRIFTILISFSLCKCHMEPFIVGGQFAKIDYFPHSVYLWVTEQGHNWVCGASILNQRIVLTAAHCLDECIHNWSVKAYAGSDTVSKMKLVRYVSRYVIHRNYDPKRTLNDIGLAFLASSLPLGPHIKRVIIKTGYDNVKRAQVAGWGMVNDETGEDTDRLKAVQQNLLSSAVCQKIGNFVSGMMCWSNSIKSRPSKGDSGSALIHDGQQIGLVSFRHPLMPELVVYTNVTYYYSWIKTCSKMLYCGKNKNSKKYPKCM